MGGHSINKISNKIKNNINEKNTGAKNIKTPVIKLAKIILVINRNQKLLSTKIQLHQKHWEYSLQSNHQAFFQPGLHQNDRLVGDCHKVRYIV